MKLKHIPFPQTVLVLSIAIYTSCSNPAPQETWYKGNLHTHSYWSDGDEFPEVIMDWYKSNGYHFVALSDHNILAEGEKWVKIRQEAIYQEAFNKYLQDYGDDWVTHKVEDGQPTVRLKTLSEYRGRFEESGEFLIIQSEEITDSYDGKPIHMNATNIQRLIRPKGGGSVREVLQNNIDAVLEQRQETGVPILPHVNHPNFGYALTLEDMVALSGERFFEVYNGHPQVHNTGDSSHISTEEMWDLINIAYLSDGKPVMYGLATDDSHHYHQQGAEWSNAGRGWIMVRSQSLEPESLITAMEAGAFYSTTGVLLSSLTKDDDKLTVEVETEPSVSYTISFIGCKKGERRPEELYGVEGSQASFTLTEDLLYVRCQITSTKLHANPVEQMLYETAWTQPVTPGD